MLLNIIRKELKSMFASPLGWAILAILSFVFGLYFTNTVGNYFDVMSGAIRPAERVGVTQFVSSQLYGFASMIMLFSVPLLSMRLIAEERKSQTMPFLFSAPLSITEIVLGKFIGLVVFLSLVIFYIALMMACLNMWADVDFGLIIANSVGLILMVASFCALGLYFSSLTSQPVVAAILTFIASFALIILDRFLAGDPSGTVAYLSLMKHFQNFSRGLINSADVAYFVLFITTFLVLTIRRLDADRLRG